MKHVGEYYLFVIAARLTVVVLFLLVPLRGAIAQLAPPERRSAPASTVLISSVFAAGTGGSPMTSANYRMLGTLGEAALPNNSTALSSTSYRLLPGFLAALPGGPRHAYLPLALRDYIRYFAGPCEVEPNDTYLTANGPLQSGASYCGHAIPEASDGYDRDYFSVYMLNPGTLTADLASYTSPGQLQLFYQVADKNHPPICVAAGGNYHIAYTGGAGWYYLLIATLGSRSSPYTLKVTYPSSAPIDCLPPSATTASPQ